MTTASDGFGGTETRMMAGVQDTPKARRTRLAYNPLTALGAAMDQTVGILHQTLVGIGQIVTGHASVRQLHGPVGIANIVQKVATFGFLPYLEFIAFLSVSIGLVNLFPSPLLDGGHLLYYAVEAVLGRPLGERAQDVGFRLGLVLVLGLMLLVTWNDLARLNLF
jgi:regulator of sigma E protease